MTQSNNICPKCKINPSFYDDDEPGPYKQYQFPSSKPNTVIAQELEPLPINPNGKTNLLKLSEELKDNFWPDYECFPFYGRVLDASEFREFSTEFGGFRKIHRFPCFL